MDASMEWWQKIKGNREKWEGLKQPTHYFENHVQLISEYFANAESSLAQNPSEALIAYNKGNIWPVACFCMTRELRMVFYILQGCRAEKNTIKTM